VSKTLVIGLFLLLVSRCALAQTDGPVSLTRTNGYFQLSNSYVTAQINAATGDLWSLKYHSLELMGYVSGHHAGYWEQSPRPSHASITIDPTQNGGERAEVSIQGPIGGFDMEIRYTLGRHDHGIYTYAIFSHPASSRAAQLGESRYGFKLSGKVFDWLSIDAARNHLMASGYDWDHGSPLNMKEARRLTTGVYKGQPEHKYDYSAYQFDIPAFGWSSTTDHVGLYIINPTIEYLSGGATKYELTGHLDDGDGGDPTLLNYWRGTHYGGSVLAVASGEAWSKVVGPMFVYVNSGPTPDDMFQDALQEAKTQADAWPYDWVNGVDYPHADERASVSGHLILNDPLAPAPQTQFTNLLVGLAYPDAAPTSRGRFGGYPGVTWQNDAKHYEFWARASADGSFVIPKVRAGKYELHAIAGGILGEYSMQPITVEAGKPLNLGDLTWQPVRYGRQLWDIGIPNRTASEFFKGDDYFHWGMYLLYGQLFPHDVDYTIGTSDYHKDWYFEQVPHVVDDDSTGRSRGRATTWTIHFTLPSAVSGTAILRLGICGVGARSIDVGVNGQSVGTVSGLIYNATINRDGIGGYWVEKDVTFDAAAMKAGQNTMTLTIPAGGLTNGIEYDYLRLELKD
jgi:rhamnogalacturonan endolyase